MNADQVLLAIRRAFGDQATGALAEYWPAIEAAVRGAMEPTKATRVVRAAETR